MKLTIIQTGEVPAPLRSRFVPYRQMFEAMFDRTGQGFEYQTINIADGEPFPHLDRLEGVVITGSAAGVYDKLAWLDPLRDFIRKGYQQRTPMLGVCFGHQIMADALGGEVRKSHKGWGLGRHTYAVTERPRYMQAAPASLAIACSHQDQVITPPANAEVILASAFTPNAGLAYGNGAALSLQPHPEFDDAYTVALAELRRGNVPDELVDTAVSSIATPSDSAQTADYIARFFKKS
ncbi:type 1 glutamine amidotransferase [Devosia neptuniae]|jgi:GMP synthase-like glutamine amidotransferase|uniref:type 1 glutamine amidotransferase n=1 Tax=Devosia TaxID=46913 RepID=UPI0022AFD8D4|nr:type 1 glutamine amidotransferase [Devosia neptuniae]MCZ4346802.1 type 1 glutamine amidotransferase [Devosia neptuniae]|tara:strand:- start:4628 stop:5335 length:708 start_codon:yes stop_codon:yes gene_type:complete